MLRDCIFREEAGLETRFIRGRTVLISSLTKRILGGIRKNLEYSRWKQARKAVRINLKHSRHTER